MNSSSNYLTHDSMSMINEISNFFERSDSKKFYENYDIDYFIHFFRTDKENGIIDMNSLEERILKYGSNTLPDPPHKSFFQLVVDALNNLTLKILLTCALVGAVLHFAFPKSGVYGNYEILDFIDSISILVSVLIVTMVSSITDYIQQKNFLEINRLKDDFLVTVIRCSTIQQISSIDLVVGDVLLVRRGDKIPCDCLYLSGNNVKLNNSQLTGETTPIKISLDFPFLCSGSYVEEGDALILACAVGPNSQNGKLLLFVTENNTNVETPLERRLNNTALQLTYIGLAVSLLLFIIKLIVWSIKISKVKFEISFLSELVEPIMVCVTIFISIVPEGLPLAITLSLGFSMKVMVKDNNFIRHLNACETMGGATTICSDKTGTLTQNNMKVVRFYFNFSEYNTFFNNLSPNNRSLINKGIDILFKSIILNTTAYEHDGKLVGQSTECALIHWIRTEFGFLEDLNLMRASFQNNLEKVYDFDSQKKTMTSYYRSTVITNSNEQKINYCCYVKGAPDRLISRCTKAMTFDGNEVQLSLEDLAHINDIINEFSSNSLRTILIAYKDKINSLEEVQNLGDSPNNLTFIGIAGIEDPLRPEVCDSIELCKKAGVVVRMVTGDYINTAKSIALQCKIIEDPVNDLVMTGEEFSNSTKLDLIEKIPKLRVLARSSPLDKYRLVSLLMEMGEVVAVTGDGSNDAPALSKANVGLSMGKSGTELAKAASDIVILDDNFKSIVTALKWGRCVYDNVRCFLQYLLTMNIPSVLLVFVGYICKDQPPFTAIQLLWSNVIVGSLGSLALATNRPTDSLLERCPYGESDPIISPVMYRNMFLIAAYQSLFLFLIFFNILEKAEYDVTLTMMFATFVYSQIFNLFHARSSNVHVKATDGLFKNPTFFIIFVIDLIVQTIVIVFGGVIFSTVAMNYKQWIIVISISIGTVVIGFFIRMIPIKDNTKILLELNKKARIEALIQQCENAENNDNDSSSDITESNYLSASTL
ncbi:putative calcium-transporting ATPase 11, plasma membrane-type [Tritrichomonas foetus]|uniref:Calcium-transporting ATPase n=1 Tax=Tritrichomonas foetus TaxID=1144522 RepID=A0A1J4KH98_9EUKA|nr:putative calcium-transporting ATPase 11, plasma membrane-type [Tritrichomonas foetus]|eukprot:OHT10563.1 putative calcium-transporting ATPase 11, plasma membrane-type [Tritrichomonas foetus]